jgi:hypothetical protein
VEARLQNLKCFACWIAQALENSSKNNGAIPEKVSWGGEKQVEYKSVEEAVDENSEDLFPSLELTLSRLWPCEYL